MGDLVLMSTLIAEEFMFDNWVDLILRLLNKKKITYLTIIKSREVYFHKPCNYNEWLEKYQELQFYGLFRMQKKSFESLFNTVIKYDQFDLIKKRYRGGNYPVEPAKSLLIFLYYMATQDTLNSIADRFQLVPATVMKIVNVILYIIVQIKNKYIYWPKPHELEYLTSEFINYPGVTGTLDGCHINIKVPNSQHASYRDRYLQHSINLMAVCTAKKLFTYVFIGFPGSAHDSRVFSNSILVRNIERFGANKYFMECNKYHLIGDAAFPLRRWLMKPYRQTANMERIEKHHNFRLSSERACIENAFGILKGRWRRLQWINTYHVSKCIEIVTAACVLHNFCINNLDQFTEVINQSDETEYSEYRENNLAEQLLGQQKRDRIALELNNN